MTKNRAGARRIGTESVPSDAPFSEEELRACLEGEQVSSNTPPEGAPPDEEWIASTWLSSWVRGATRGLLDVDAERGSIVDREGPLVFDFHWRPVLLGHTLARIARDEANRNRATANCAAMMLEGVLRSLRKDAEPLIARRAVSVHTLDCLCHCVAAVADAEGRLHQNWSDGGIWPGVSVVGWHEAALAGRAIADVVLRQRGVSPALLPDQPAQSGDYIEVRAYLDALVKACAEPFAAPPEVTAPPTTQGTLRESERCVQVALREKNVPLVTDDLAEVAFGNRPATSEQKRLFAEMTRRKLLWNPHDRRGYRLPEWKARRPPSPDRAQHESSAD